MNQDLAITSYGQVARWDLAAEPLQHLTQDQLDALIERIDDFIFTEIDQVTKGA